MESFIYANTLGALDCMGFFIQNEKQFFDGRL